MLAELSTTEPVLSEEALVEESRQRTSQALDPRERTWEFGCAAAFIAANLALIALGDWDTAIDLPTVLVLIAGYVLASRVMFEVGVGYTDATQLIFVPMLFWLPVELVPVVVLVANLMSQLPEFLRGARHPQRAWLAFSASWYAIGPVAVLAMAGVPESPLAAWPILVAAFAGQAIVNFVVNALREWFVYRIPVSSQVAEAAWYLSIDVLLSAIGLTVAIAGLDADSLTLLVLPLLALMALFARQRRRGLESALELSEAYRGTTILLADVIEHDDHYTGSHSKGVVSLSTQVAREMGLDREQARSVEFAALLHDVGKLAISKEIINKEGPLSADEWALMKLHTITGEEMLGKIGGRFEEVAKIVRSSHEHWDGSGYPDGLNGVAIPLEARIVSCCDAFNAMTTDRSYRPAMTTGEALEELRACAGAQFDPGVAWTVIRIVEGSERARFEPMLRAAGPPSREGQEGLAALAPAVLQPMDQPQT